VRPTTRTRLTLLLLAFACTQPTPYVEPKETGGSGDEVVGGKGMEPAAGRGGAGRGGAGGRGGSPSMDALDGSGADAARSDAPASADFAQPSGNCTPGTSRCGGEQTPEACSPAGEWKAGSRCPFVCSGAGACTGSCQPGTARCSGADKLTPETCDATGTWMAQAPCQNLCSSGSCGGSCTPGGKRCGANQTPETCSPQGTWEPGQPCARVCEGNGVCGGDCRPDDRSCSDLVPRTCDSTGHWQSNAACNFMCSDGTCTGSCKPGSHRCSADKMALETCGGDAVTWTETEACDAGCDSAAGACKTCSGSTRACDGGCYAKTDPKHCGASCLACPSPAGATASCDGTSCGLTCGGGYLTCFANDPSKKTCSLQSRDFESGTNEDFYLFDGVTGDTYLDTRVSIRKAHSGTHALGVSMDAFPKPWWSVRLCGSVDSGSGYDMRGRTVSFWYYLDRPDAPVNSYLWVWVGSTADKYFEFSQLRQWVQVTTVIDTSADNVSDQLGFQFVGGDNASGMLYVDDVQIQ
jgi:hypothetical protein